MKTRIFSMILAVALAAGLLPAPVWAEDAVQNTAAEAEGPAQDTAAEVEDPAPTATEGTCGSGVAWTLADGVLTISYTGTGTGKMTEYDYPIPPPWYDDKSSIVEVKIESGVSSIGSNAFYGSTNLTDIIIPDSVTSIGDRAFSDCTSLTSINIPDNVTSIGRFAFSSCSSLTSITIPDGVTDIEYCTFYLCSSLTNVVIPDSVTSIGGSAFGVCSNLTSIVIPQGVSSIGELAFDTCKKLTSVTIPSSVVSIGKDAFMWCSSLTDVYYCNTEKKDEITAVNIHLDGNLWYPGEAELTYKSQTSESADGDEPLVITITSDRPLNPLKSRAATTIDYVTVDTGDTGLVFTGTELADDHTLLVTLAGTSNAGNVTVTIAPEGFAGPANFTSRSTVAGGVDVASGSFGEAPKPDPAPENPTTPTTPTRPTRPSYPSDPVPAPSVDPEGVLAPGEDMIPPPVPEPPESPIQGIVKDETGIRDWIDRIDPPEYAKNLYNTLVDGSGGGPGKTPPYLVEDQYFALPSNASAADGQEVLYVECVDFDLADLYANGTVSLGASVFEDDDFFWVNADLSDRQVDYASLELGDVVKTASFNGIFVTSIPKDADFDETKKTACSYISTVYQAFDRDHPEVFWLSGKCRVRIPTVRTGDGETAYFFLVLVDKEGFTMRAPAWTADGAVADGIQRREKAVETILGTVTAKAPAGIVRELNRWLTEHNQYNTTPDLTTIGNEPHECLSALEGRIDRDGPVCDGYSRAFKVLCDRLNIPCVLENGYAKTSADSKGTFHMWNAVQIAGQWYGVDVTWNDPTVKGFVGARSGKENEQFLLVGLDTIVRGMTFAASHPANNRAAVDGVAFDNGPELSSIAFSAITANAGLSALPFDDVAEGTWYYDSVAYVYEWNLMMGTSPVKFSPGGVTTRQQLWMILARMDGKQPRSMEAARTWAVNRGVSDGSDPGGALTREQLVTMLYRYCGLKGYDVAAYASLSGFTDGRDVAEYAKQAMGWAVANGIVTGMGDGSISPQSTATRAQMAAVVERICRSSVR